MNEKIKNIIKHSSKKAKANKKEHVIFGNIVVLIKDPLPINFNIEVALRDLEETIPKHYTRNIDAIYIGQFQDLISREAQAKYENGAIFVTNEQHGEYDMIDDIVHEFAHALEESYSYYLYADGKLEMEFLKKRAHLRRILKLEDYNVSKYDFLNVEYDRSFDSFLYKKVGYSDLHSLSFDLFVSPYGATSLREYFANGFENYYLEDPEIVKQISPELFRKIEKLHNVQYENDHLV